MPAPVVPTTDGLTWRPATTDDLDSLVEFNRATGLADHPEYVEARDETAEELAHSYIDLPLDSLVAIDDATGVVVAFGLVIFPPGQETLVRAILGGGVHPDWRGRGIGRVLLAWQEARALQRLGTSAKKLPGWVIVDADDRAVATVSLFERMGFTASRWFLTQERIVAEPIPEVAFDEAVTIVPYRDELSHSTHLAKNAAFRDHWGSQPSTDEQWTSMVGLSSFRAEHTYLAVTADDEVVGFVVTFVTESDWELQGYSSGYIGLVGVVREWRKKGIAPALLARVLHSYRDAGYERAGLDVDSDNPTGALGLYTGMGFFGTTSSANYTKIY